VIRARRDYLRACRGHFRAERLNICVQKKPLLNIAADRTLERIALELGDWDCLNLRFLLQAHLCAAQQAPHHIPDRGANCSLRAVMRPQTGVNSIIHMISFGAARWRVPRQPYETSALAR
jgi:hypothetical protein